MTEVCGAGRDSGGGIGAAGAGLVTSATFSILGFESATGAGTEASAGAGVFVGSTTGVVFVEISTFCFLSLTVAGTGGTGAGGAAALGDPGTATGFSTTVVVTVEVAAGAGTGLATSLVGAVGVFSGAATSPRGFAVTLVSCFFPETIIGGAVGTIGGFG